MDDDTRIRFTLREGVTFHNGEPFNAAAVQYTFDRLLGEQGQAGPAAIELHGDRPASRSIDEFTVDFILESTRSRC